MVAPGTLAEHLPRHWEVLDTMRVAEDSPYPDDPGALSIAPGTRLRLVGTDYLWEPGYGYDRGWYRFQVLDGELAGSVVAVVVTEPSDPPASLRAVPRGAK